MCYHCDTKSENRLSTTTSVAKFRRSNMEIDCLMEKLRQRPPVARISSHQRPPSSAATRWRSSANATEQKSNALSLSPANNSSLPGSISKPWKKDPTQNRDGLQRQ
ncbi:hypothetical protein L6452_05578 [Arctium lappa]|uniref:Uncharacterized protein n=1 Tax=Arctium lappa TaxID=4217 RepID=A0ACB9EH33_ARCLA|nr:hypothetical protein L6452_05578 [Arctium lappa]